MARYILLVAAAIIIAGCSSDDLNPGGTAPDALEEALYREAAQEALRIAGPAHNAVNPLQGLWLNEMSTGTWFIEGRIFAWYPIGYSPFDTYAIFISASHRSGDSLWLYGIMRDRSHTASLTGAIDDSAMACTARFTFPDSTTEDVEFTLKLTDPANVQR